jgi:hypothetical protein
LQGSQQVNRIDVIGLNSKDFRARRFALLEDSCLIPGARHCGELVDIGGSCRMTWLSATGLRAFVKIAHCEAQRPHVALHTAKLTRSNAKTNIHKLLRGRAVSNRRSLSA